MVKPNVQSGSKKTSRARGAWAIGVGQARLVPRNEGAFCVWRTLALLGGLAAISWTALTRAADPDPAALEFFEKRVRPVLVERCYSCHSTGAEKLKGGLWLDSREALLRGGEAGPAVDLDNPEQSRLLVAVRYENPDLQMPPKGKLEERAIADLTTWIKQGAPWPANPAQSATNATASFDLEKRRREHWAWQPVRSVSPPIVKDKTWGRHPVDRFLWARLQQEKLRPAPPAERATLLRRLSFDLTGLPPSASEVSGFERDRRARAWDEQVDRLLASPRFGERWARHWLDLVRYAETLGHEFDYTTPNAWRYRDYVIRALNADVPYRQWAQEQIAGDLLPQPRFDPQEKINESGIGPAFFWLGQREHSPVDVRLHGAEVIDNQIDVLTKTFLGLTVSCARCHDHKFDAISTKDYYALSGIMSSARYTQTSLEPPEALRERITNLQQRQQALREALAEVWLGPAAPTGEAPPASAPAPVPPNSDVITLADFTREDYAGWFVEGEAFGPRPAPAGTLLVGPTNAPVQILTEAAAHSGAVSRRLQGALRSPTFTLARRYLHILAAGRNARLNVPVDNFTMICDPIYGGLKRFVDHDEFRWITIDVEMWKGHRAFIEFLDFVTPDLVDGGHRDGYDSNGWIAVRRVVFSSQSTPPTPATLEAPAAGSVTRATVEAWRRGEHLAPAVLAQLNQLPVAMDSPAGRRLAERLAAYRSAEADVPLPRRAPGFAEGSGIDEYVFVRGNHRNQGETVPRRFLEALGGARQPAIREGSGRRELAEQITDPDNPLFARVMVNRVWLHLFGRGLVATPDDFGGLGTAPSHPELLDWLAHWFRTEGQWSVKRLIRLLVTSQAYRMSSRPADEEAEARDPDNRWWHRMPVRRLEGEAIRDALLALSGRLDVKMYGPPVPVFLNEFMDGRGRPASSGPLDGEGRRSVYLEVRRNFLAPMMRAFDAPVPFTTVGRRSVSNVPAQSLIMMNDPFVQDQAARWAERLQREIPQTDARITAAFRQALGRAPTRAESEQVGAFLQAQGAHDAAGTAAAWKDCCHALLNAKEFILLP